MKKSKIVFIGVIIILLIGMTSIYAEFLESEEGVSFIEQPDSVTISDIQLSAEFQHILEAQGVVERYKEFLIKMNVQTIYQEELEGIILQGTKASDVMIAYDFLQTDYAPKTQLNNLLQMKNEGMTWEQIFINYKKHSSEFIPTNFEQRYLQELIDVATINRDDIMIADHIAHSAQADPKEIIDKRLSGMSVKEICLFYDLLGSQEVIPHVSISLETLNGYLDAGYDEEYIAKSFVLAKRVEQPIETVIQRKGKGITDEALIEAYLKNKYGK